ncbi:MAG TPA: SMP-30/gluconolactonase/LRE family protein [Paracoccaceae bacterium]|nr:SMP-30/gluconolactonase/LRE family protein [Paracoccaceae bacterium]HMO72561.1 SMP-30/gluconolactonase/LRE family protein [Paracoccaceae bacterium]
MIFDNRICALGEGPLWHPMREQLFWFDITGRRMLTRRGEEAQEWHFPEMVSAAGWTGPDGLVIASEQALFLFDLASGTKTPLCPLEDDNAATRSNDGRADPQGGFWIGTMGKRAEPGLGSIWRWHRGELRRLYAGMTIPNAISFPPGGGTAQFTDTETRRVMRVALDAAGWPRGTPEAFLDVSAEELNPDGAVVDAAGLTWLAEWDAGRVAAYAPDGARVTSVSFDAPHTSCPAFGGTTLYCTTATQGMGAEARARHPAAGMTFAAANVARGQAEHMVIL